MSADRSRAVVLVCTVCEHLWELTVDELVGEGDSTGCSVCGGWTWMAELTETGEEIVTGVGGGE